jgi:ribosomal protein S18 acetylase RimI-like enzyme
MPEGANPLLHPDLRIRSAGEDDVDALTRLINAAFFVEAPFIGGDRIDAAGVRAYMAKGKFLLAELVAENSAAFAGCVFCELHADRGYIGLLSVAPAKQGQGLGRLLMSHAENYFRNENCQAVDLRIVSARTELPSFYRHLGYAETGTAPFPPDVQTKVPCHFILMSKALC